MPFDLRRMCLRFLQICLPLAFVTPFFYITTTTFPFVTGKVWIFRGLVELLVPAYLMLLVLSPEHRPKKEPVFLAVAFFCTSLLLSTVFGVDPYRSMWANHERMTGVYTILHYALFFLMAATAYRTRKQWTVVFLVSIGASVVMTFIALYERSHSGFLASTAGGRVWGTLGNYIYLANYLLFHLYFIGMILFRQSLKMPARLALWSIAFLEILVVGYTETRGTTIAVIVTGLLLLVWLMVRKPRIRVAGAVFFICLALAGSVLYFNRSERWVRKIPGVGRVVNTQIQDGGVMTRLIAWNIALQAFVARPVFGWGPENFYYAFNQYYNPASLRYSAYETWFDRPHNTVLDVLSSTGVVGMLAYLSLFLAAYITIVRNIRNGTMREWEGMLTGGMLFAYVVQNLTVFDSHTSYLYFFFLLAFVAGLRPEAPPSAAESPASQRIALVVGAVSLVGAISLVMWSSVTPFRANRLGLYATSAARLGQNVNEAIRLYVEALALPTQHKNDLRIDAARDVAELVPMLNLPADQAAAAFDWAIARVEENRQARPRDVYDGIVLGQIYLTYAQIKPELIGKAREVLESILPYSPRRQQIVFLLVRIAFAEGRHDDAARMLQDSLADEEQVGELHWLIAFLAHERGDLQTAEKALEKAEDLQYRWHGVEELAFAVETHLQAGVADRALATADALMRSDPKNAQYIVFVSRAWELNGDRKNALAALEAALKLDPQLATDPAIQAYQRQLAQ